MNWWGYTFNDWYHVNLYQKFSLSSIALSSMKNVRLNFCTNRQGTTQMSEWGHTFNVSSVFLLIELVLQLYKKIEQKFSKFSTTLLLLSSTLSETKQIVINWIIPEPIWAKQSFCAAYDWGNQRGTHASIYH